VARKYRGKFWFKRLDWVKGRIAIHTVDDRILIFDPVSDRKAD
jgi:hypothetical protein